MNNRPNLPEIKVEKLIKQLIIKVGDKLAFFVIKKALIKYECNFYFIILE